MKILTSELPDNVDLSWLLENGCQIQYIPYQDGKEIKQGEFVETFGKVDYLFSANKIYRLRYGIDDDIFTPIEKDGQLWISSIELMEKAQLVNSPPVWVHTKGVRVLGLVKNVDYIGERKDKSQKIIRYLFTLEAAVKMLRNSKGGRYAYLNLKKKAETLLGRKIYDE